MAVELKNGLQGVAVELKNGLQGVAGSSKRGFNMWRGAPEGASRRGEL